MRESSKSGGPDPRLGEGGEPKHEHGEKAEHEDNSELYCIIVEIETRVSLLQNSYHAATSNTTIDARRHGTIQYNDS